MMDMAAPKSQSTARDMLIGYLEDVAEIPTEDGAARIAEELGIRGVYVRPDYLMEVWTEAFTGGSGTKCHI